MNTGHFIAIASDELTEAEAEDYRVLREMERGLTVTGKHRAMRSSAEALEDYIINGCVM